MDATRFARPARPEPSVFLVLGFYRRSCGCRVADRTLVRPLCIARLRAARGANRRLAVCVAPRCRPVAGRCGCARAPTPFGARVRAEACSINHAVWTGRGAAGCRPGGSGSFAGGIGSGAAIASSRSGACGKKRLARCGSKQAACARTAACVSRVCLNECLRVQ